MKIHKFDTRKGYKQYNIETTFTPFPAIYYQRYRNGNRVIAFAWLWVVLFLDLPAREDTLNFKWTVGK